MHEPFLLSLCSFYLQKRKIEELVELSIRNVLISVHSLKFYPHIYQRRNINLVGAHNYKMIF